MSDQELALLHLAVAGTFYSLATTWKWKPGKILNMVLSAFYGFTALGYQIQAWVK